MHFNQFLLFAAGLYLTYAFGMFNFGIAMLLFIHVIYSQYFKRSAADSQHISFDMKQDNYVILVNKNIVFFKMKYYFKFQYVAIHSNNKA